jgi:hypothetical protein
MQGSWPVGIATALSVTSGPMWRVARRAPSQHGHRPASADGVAAPSQPSKPTWRGVARCGSNTCRSWGLRHGPVRNAPLPECGCRRDTRKSTRSSTELARGEFVDERAHSAVGVVSDQAHPLDAVDALGRFVGVPVAQLGSVGDLDLGFAAEGDDEVDGRSSSGSIGFGVSPMMSAPTSVSTSAERALMEVACEPTRRTGTAPFLAGRIAGGAAGCGPAVFVARSERYGHLLALSRSRWHERTARW